MPETSIGSTRRLAQRPTNSFSTLDNTPSKVLVLATASASAIARAAGVSLKVGKDIVKLRSKRPALGVLDLAGLAGLREAGLERLVRRALLPSDRQIVITKVEPAKQRIMSHQPFALRTSFACNKGEQPVLASVRVEWAGASFTVEQRVTNRDWRAGYVDLAFDRKRTLPPGPATFRVSLYTQKGSQATFRATCLVLPSNPFSLALSPNTNLVTGTFSARGVRNGSAFDTAISVTLSNGDSNAVGMQTQFTWKFWDGGIGGSLVEQGTGNFGGSIVVPAFGTWGGWISFHSPQGSGVFGKYDGKEDMTIEIIMTRASGATISGTITCRTMFQFGVNVTRVAFEDFGGLENSDLDAAASVTRTIYERHDVTFVTDDRGIERARAGPFENITSDSEARDLWEQWSGPGTNDNIDAFVVNQLLIDGKYDGLDGDIPGPTSHSGRSSGTVQNKSGFVDGSGNARLHVEYLGMLIGHELGHYLGLEHVSDAGNLMLPSSGTTDTALTYDQYRKIIRHGWVFIA